MWQRGCARLRTLRSWRHKALAFTGGAVLAVGVVAAIFPAVYAARSRGIARLDSSRGARALGAPVRTGLIAAGAGAALWAGRWVAPLLFDGRSPRDPLALAVAALVLVTAALAASLLPARRAAQADPRQALQAE